MHNKNKENINYFLNNNNKEIMCITQMLNFKKIAYGDESLTSLSRIWLPLWWLKNLLREIGSITINFFKELLPKTT